MRCAEAERAPSRQESSGGGAADHQVERAALEQAAAADSLGPSPNQSPRSQALLQLRAALDTSPRVQSQRALQRAMNAPLQKNPNATGLPDHLKAGVEQLSGLAMDDVRVHYNSAKPAAVQAHAYAQGTDIHLAPGQEQHLPHEAWHAVQQKQGRVKPTLQLKGVAINDDTGLEREADAMGDKAAHLKAFVPSSALRENAVPVGQPASRVAQRKPLDVRVTGVTHLVKATQGSIMEGEETMEVSEGQAIVIETDEKLRSRRGPNQEIFGEFDRARTADYRWFRVLSVDGKPVEADMYIRDETFETKEPEAKGKRPAIIKGHGRDRMQPEQAQLHAVAAEIIRDSAQAPSAGEISALVSKRREENKTEQDKKREQAGLPALGHDPMKTLRVMQIAYAFSTNQKIEQMAASESESDAGFVREVSDILYAATGRQLVQSWGVSTSNTVGQLGLAWDFFVQGVGALESDPAALDYYLAEVLAHDKGYAQILGAAMVYGDHQGQPAGSAQSFETVLRKALSRSRKQNIWAGGQAGGDKDIRAQLTRTNVETLVSLPSEAVQQENMWGAVVQALMDSASPSPQQWDLAYIKTIGANRGALFDAVRAQVPDEFKLDSDALDQAIDGLEKILLAGDDDEEGDEETK